MSKAQAHALMRKYHGRGFFDFLKKAGKTLWGGAKKGLSLASKAAQFAAPLLEARGLGGVGSAIQSANRMFNGPQDGDEDFVPDAPPMGGRLKYGRRHSTKGRGVYLARSR